MENLRKKSKNQSLDFLVVILNTLYPCKERLSNLIIISYQTIR